MAPRKKLKAEDFAVTGADPVLRNDEGLSPADEACPALTEAEINEAIADYIDAGVKVRVTTEHWFLEKEYFVPRKRGLPLKKKLANSGSVYMPVKAVIHSAAMLYTRFQEVEQIFASRNNKRGSKYGEMGEITGKDGKPIESPEAA